MFRFCFSRLGSREEAEDAVQSTFLNAHRALQRGVTPDAELPWLIKIAHNVCLTRRRSSRRRGRVEAAYDLDSMQDYLAAPSHDTPDELLRLNDALAHLPDSQRRAILLREWQGLSYAEISRELRVTQSAVEALIFRARRSLAANLETVIPRPRVLARVRHAVDLGWLVAGAKALLTGGAAAKSVAAAVAVSGAAVIAATPTSVPVSDPPRPATPATARPAPTATADAPTIAHDRPRLVVVPATAERRPVRNEPKRAATRPARAQPAVAKPESKQVPDSATTPPAVTHEKTKKERARTLPAEATPDAEVTRAKPAKTKEPRQRKADAQPGPGASATDARAKEPKPKPEKEPKAEQQPAASADTSEKKPKQEAAPADVGGEQPKENGKG